ncbi:UDP-N-acetylmuramate dehydrogenase [Paraferrimonas haliotis]|uniref:UDP-N-acetylenolpyruvoylglucosamine reductase n=1 Tax=Paraferrimonas haliotis TaxID=2013866 RepID=A0AA37WX17_9GAMM|nr:UDP-N-acetylmuramate dehydrogenase [Paraferrimonas haliotis]GLS82025.1 UDP-N-acetylenolpyruvoylglucosamine reductase [Paraferrimonas haliotis]
MSLVNLSQHHTFGFDAHCRALKIIQSKDDLHSYMASNYAKAPLMLGEGSNVVFLEDYQGDVLLNRIMKREIIKLGDYYRITLGSGEGWHDVVRWLVEQGIGGVENLALIPGTAGAAPIQNIGAYGVELSDILYSVTYLEIETGKEVRLFNQDCQFGYRDSIFKRALKGNAWIIEIVIDLPIDWQPKLNYGPLKSLQNHESLTPKSVFDKVCEIRMAKLPDPKLLGNAGSFFKNPVVSAKTHKILLEKDPSLVSFALADGSHKLAAGYLIERCHLKGHAEGKVAVHANQALVLVNQGGGTASQLKRLVSKIINTVMHTYGIRLEPEVRLYDCVGEYIGVVDG